MILIRPNKANVNPLASLFTYYYFNSIFKKIKHYLLISSKKLRNFYKFSIFTVLTVLLFTFKMGNLSFQKPKIPILQKISRFLLVISFKFHQNQRFHPR